MFVKNAPTDTTHREAGGVMTDKLRAAALAATVKNYLTVGT